MNTLTDPDFRWLTTFLREESGINLEADKFYLVENRLEDLRRALGLKSVRNLLSELREHPRSGTSQRLLETLATHETSFFRDFSPFEILCDTILPEVAQGCLKVWSAACSTGQEPYSLAMTFARHRKRNPRSAEMRILASDMGEAVLARAERGFYSQLEVERGLPREMLLEYFVEESGGWRICDGLRQLVTFDKVNLVQLGTFPGTIFDVIFCRNVLIYFNLETKRKVLEALHRQLHPQGYLFLGATEVLLGVTDLFECGYVGPGMHYRPKPNGRRQPLSAAPVVRQ